MTHGDALDPNTAEEADVDHAEGSHRDGGGAR